MRKWEKEEEDFFFHIFAETFMETRGPVPITLD